MFLTGIFLVEVIKVAKLKLLFTLLLMPTLMTLTMPLKAETYPKLGQVIKVEPTINVHHERVLVEPNVWHEYQDIGGTLPPDSYNLYGPKEPYAVSVKINSVSPSGKKLTVTIFVGRDPEWAGLLGAGQSSPTITCNDQTTYVRVENQNDVTVTYTGQIDWVFH